MELQPQNFNMEPEIHPFEKDKKHLNQTSILEFHVHFRGSIFSALSRNPLGRGSIFQTERSGAETGAGGRIRDGESTGKGSLVRGTWLHEIMTGWLVNLPPLLKYPSETRGLRRTY